MPGILKTYKFGILPGFDRADYFSQNVKIFKWGEHTVIETACQLIRFQLNEICSKGT